MGVRANDICRVYLYTQTSLFLTFPYPCASRRFAPAHKASRKDQFPLGAFNEKIAVLFFYHNSDMSKRREISAQERIEEIKEDSSHLRQGTIQEMSKQCE